MKYSPLVELLSVLSVVTTFAWYAVPLRVQRNIYKVFQLRQPVASSKLLESVIPAFPAAIQSGKDKNRSRFNAARGAQNSCLTNLDKQN